MTAPYSITTKNANKCPHGFPVGTCPICSNMSGGISKDKNKPRVAGEMSYNECMAEWRRMQSQKEAKAEKQKEFMTELLSNKILETLAKLAKFRSMLAQNIEKLPSVIKTPIKIISNIAQNIVKLVTQSTNNIQNFLFSAKENIAKFINTISEKIPILLSEIKNYITLNLEKIILTPAKTLLTLFIGKEKKENKEDNKQREKIKKILKKIFKIYFKEKDDNKDNKKQ